MVYKKHLAELESRTLRSNMNPHFIYNALNGVQSVMILKGELESNRYIGMLSNLLRFTLEMSSKEKINLKEELHYIESYLGLQKMRLNHKMTFSIETKLSKPLITYSLPPMLLQPLVENSILHGVSSLKNETGIIKVKVWDCATFLNLSVEDNGIGIEASKKLKQKNKKMTKSFAMQILKERIDIYNYFEKKHMTYRIKNTPPEGFLQGTSVNIQIPLNSI